MISFNQALLSGKGFGISLRKDRVGDKVGKSWNSASRMLWFSEMKKEEGESVMDDLCKLESLT